MDNKFTLDVCSIFENFVPEIIILLASFGVKMRQDSGDLWVVEIEGSPQAMHLYDLPCCWVGYSNGVRIGVRRDVDGIALTIQEMVIGGLRVTKHFS